jgi:hypothetical protein
MPPLYGEGGHRRTEMRRSTDNFLLIDAHVLGENPISGPPRRRRKREANQQYLMRSARMESMPRFPVKRVYAAHAK